MIRKATVLDLPAVKEIYNYAVLTLPQPMT